MTVDDIDRLTQFDGIIKNRKKIEAAVGNAKLFMEIQKEFGSFSNYIWGFTNNKIIKRQNKELPASTPLSDKISKDLKKRGMKYVRDKMS